MKVLSCNECNVMQNDVMQCNGVQCSYIPSLPERVREPSMDYSSGQVRRSCSCSEHVSSIICDLFAPFKVTLHFDKLFFYHFNEILIYQYK